VSDSRRGDLARQGLGSTRPAGAGTDRIQDASRPVIGLWSEIPKHGRWSNEGISRIVGFLIEGAARLGLFRFIVVVRTGIAEVVREDLRHLQAVEHRDWTVVEKPEDFQATLTAEQIETARRFRIDPDCALQALFANRELSVDGWIVTFPNMTGAALLKSRRATMLPDAIPFDFPLGWHDEAHWGEAGEWVVWRQIAGLALRSSDVIIAHSKHVARRHGVGLLECDPDHIRVVPHAPPDLAHLVPEAEAGRRSEASLAAAANRMRSHAARVGWRYLADFPFEETPYIVVSTQDRPTKNINRAAEALVSLLRGEFVNLKMFMTAAFHEGADWTLLPGLVEKQGLQFDVVSMRDLPRETHAALYHCAAVTVHPSYYEGIVGTLTFYESVSVGTPCVFARGPHVKELLEIHPELARGVFDPYDLAALKRCLRDALDNREEFLAIQREACLRMLERSWDAVARVYAEAAIGRDF
jgi:glycosyltransferase involved in cell wall biosynthesis